jgi:integrase
MMSMVEGCFRDLLTVSYDCGARPFEIKDLQARHVDLDKRCAVIPAEEAKGRSHTRTFYFPTDRSLEVVRRLCAERTQGPLFVNTRGNKWTGDAVKCRFESLEIDFGLAEMKRKGIELDVSKESIAAVIKTLKPTRKDKQSGREVPKKKWELRKEARQKLIAEQARRYGKRFNHYAFRRAFITRKIIAGVDSHVVAKLSGHQSTAMIDKHYSQVASDHDFMLRMAQKDL